jgi:hypothetical protein
VRPGVPLYDGRTGNFSSPTLDPSWNFYGGAAGEGGQLFDVIQFEAGALLAQELVTMPRDKSTVPPYSIDISPVAWRQLASIPQDVYLLVQQRLRELAAQAAEGRLPSAGGLSREALASFIAGNLTARCVADGYARTVRLMVLEYPPAPASNEVRGGQKPELFE